eukprot:g6618.t1
MAMTGPGGTLAGTRRPSWDLFVSTPAHRVRRSEGMKSWKLERGSAARAQKLQAMTSIKLDGCHELDRDPKRQPTSIADWFERYGRPEPKSRFACCKSRLTPDNRLFGGSLTLYSEECSGGTMRTQVFRRKGGGTNQFVGHKAMMQ